MRFLIPLYLMFAASPLFAAAPEQIDASFDVLTEGVKIAEVTEKFTRNGEHYRIESVTKPVGLLALFKPDTLYVVSEGHVGVQGLQPQSFSYTRSKDTLKNTAAEFNWSLGHVSLSDRYGQRNEPLPALTQDRLSILYQFRYIPFLRERKEYTNHITNGSKIDLRQYTITPRQILKLPLGKLETLYLATQPQETHWKTEIWLSIENGNFPCKLIVTEDNGSQLTQLLTALRITQ